MYRNNGSKNRILIGIIICCIVLLIFVTQNDTQRNTRFMIKPSLTIHRETDRYNIHNVDKNDKISTSDHNTIINLFLNRKNQSIKHINDFKKSKFRPTDEKYYNRYLKYEFLKEFQHTMVDFYKSDVEIINNKYWNFSIGDEIRIKIVLYDVHGRRLKVGGDWLKIWMREPVKGAGTAGFVIDHADGSYTGVLRALWNGSPVIKISLSFPKETIGLFGNNLRKNEMLFKIFGIYKNINGESGNGKCGTFPSARACNFTALNYGMNWFCTLPKKGKFECSDWIAPKAEMIAKFSEEELSFLRYHSNNLMKEIPITIQGDRLKMNTTHSCNHIKASETWTKKHPFGYFYNNRWNSFLCLDDLPKTGQVYKECLKDREIYMIGDSSLRMWFISMVKMLNLDLTIGPAQVLTGEAWHRLVQAESTATSRDNISVIWSPHELPFYSGHGGPFKLYKPAKFFFKHINSDYPIIVLHWYLHLSPIIPSVFEEHVQHAKLSIIEFLKRVPTATIFIKGPHNIDIERNQGIPHDFVRFYQEEMLFQVFNDIRNRVYFLNEWDITVAAESKETHPSEDINKAMIHNMLKLIC